ncbi:MAG: hypothetical protein QOH21_1545, partial [Acidobacteriota bacterium]|nr:hypothetical protein [Acidobacteriota bacterium]
MNSLWNWFAALGPSDRLNVVTFAGAAVAFAFGLWQYRNGQKWRRMEWIAKEMDAFFADSGVTKAQQMIDWGTRPIELHPKRGTEAERIV